MTEFGEQRSRDPHDATPTDRPQQTPCQQRPCRSLEDDMPVMVEVEAVLEVGFTRGDRSATLRLAIRVAIPLALVTLLAMILGSVL